MRKGYSLVEALVALALLGFAVELLRFMHQSPEQSNTTRSKALALCKSHSLGLTQTRHADDLEMDTVIDGRRYTLRDSLYSRGPLTCIQTQIRTDGREMAKLCQCLRI